MRHNKARFAANTGCICKERNAVRDVFCKLPQGAPAKAPGRVATLAKGYDHSLRAAPCQEPLLAC